MNEEYGSDTSGVLHFGKVVRIDDECFDKVENQRTKAKTKDDQAIGQTTVMRQPLHGYL